MKRSVVHINTKELGLAGDCILTLAVNKIVGTSVERYHGGSTSQTYALYIFTVNDTFKFPMEWNNSVPDKEQRELLEVVHAELVKEIWGDDKLSLSITSRKFGL